MKVTDLNEPRLIRWRDLEPRWVVPHSKEANYLRFNLSYVGGPEGFVNINTETDLISMRTAIGLMWMPVGQRQFGLHKHTVCESYVILQGAVDSLGPKVDADKIPHDRAETMDLLHMPVGAPHASRTVGDEDVMLLWFHDALERDDAAVYFDEDDPELAGSPHTECVHWRSLEPSWDAPGAKEASTMQMQTSYIGGPDGYLNHNRDQAIVSEKNAAGTVEIPIGNAELPVAREAVRYCLVTSGVATVVGRPDLGIAEKWDMFVMPQNEEFALRAVGLEPLRMIWILEAPEKVS